MQPQTKFSHKKIQVLKCFSIVGVHNPSFQCERTNVPPSETYQPPTITITTSITVQIAETAD